MKKNELLEKLKNGTFDLTETITSSQFKDIEVARWFFKNVVEDGSLSHIIYSYSKRKDYNLVRFAKIYDVLLDTSYKYTPELKTNNYENLKDLALYLEKDDREFLYMVVGSIIKYNNSDNKKDREQTIFDLCQYVIDNNINSKIQNWLYIICVENTDFYKDILDNYILQILKLLSSKKDTIDMIDKYNLDIFNCYHKNMPQFNMLEKINTFLNTGYRFDISIDEYTTNLDLILNELEKHPEILTLLNDSGVFENSNIINDLWTKYYTAKNTNILLYFVDTLYENNMYDLILNEKEEEYNYILCDKLISSFKTNNNVAHEKYIIIVSRLLKVLNWQHIGMLIKTYSCEYMWKYFADTNAPFRDEITLKFLTDITILNLDILTICDIGEINFEYLLQLTVRLNQFLLTKVYGYGYLYEEEWLKTVNILKDKGYTDKEIEFIKNKCVYIRER